MARAGVPADRVVQEVPVVRVAVQADREVQVGRVGPVVRRAVQVDPVVRAVQVDPAVQVVPALVDREVPVAQAVRAGTRAGPVRPSAV